MISWVILWEIQHEQQRETSTEWGPPFKRMISNMGSTEEYFKY